MSLVLLAVTLAAAGGSGLCFGLWLLSLAPDRFWLDRPRSWNLLMVLVYALPLAGIEAVVIALGGRLA